VVIVPYKDDAQLNETIMQLLDEIHHYVEMKQCTSEETVTQAMDRHHLFWE